MEKYLLWLDGKVILLVEFLKEYPLEGRLGFFRRIEFEEAAIAEKERNLFVLEFSQTEIRDSGGRGLVIYREERSALESYIL